MTELFKGCRAVLVGIMLGGCGGSMPDESSITALHLTTSAAIPENPPPANVDVTLTDAARVRAIYEATLELPNFPPGEYHCPNDAGYGHTLVFTGKSDVSVTATLQVGGCRGATIAGDPPARQTTDAYWTLLAQNLGVDKASLLEAAAH